MKVTTEVLERCETLVTLEVAPKKEKNMLEKAAKRIAKEVKIPGFRPGKAPYSVVVRRFGLETIQQEAIEQSVDKLIQDALKESKLVPYARVSLDEIEWNPLTVKVKVPTKPEVELGDYRDIRLEIEAIEVTDEDVEETLKNMQERNATWSPVERPAEMGDLVTMAVVEKDGDEVLSERDSVEQELESPEKHEGHNHPDMSTPLLGLSAGEEKIFTLTYPEDAEDDRYAGKEITVEVSVGSVKEKELDPIDDEFAQSFSDHETLDKFKEEVFESLVEQRKREQDQKLGNEAVDKILEDGTLEWPQAFEDENIEQELQRVDRQMSAYGLTLESYFQMQGISEDDYKEQIREQVVAQLKRSLILGKVVDLEKLKVEESEILERAKLIAEYSGGGEQVWRNILSSQSHRIRVAEELLLDKAMDRLAAIAKGEEPEIESGDADASQAADETVDVPEDMAETKSDVDQVDAESADEDASDSAAEALGELDKEES